MSDGKLVGDAGRYWTINEDIRQNGMMLILSWTSQVDQLFLLKVHAQATAYCENKTPNQLSMSLYITQTAYKHDEVSNDYILYCKHYYINNTWLTRLVLWNLNPETIQNYMFYWYQQTRIWIMSVVGSNLDIAFMSLAS